MYPSWYNKFVIVNFKNVEWLDSYSLDFCVFRSVISVMTTIRLHCNILYPIWRSLCYNFVSHLLQVQYSVSFRKLIWVCHVIIICVQCHVASRIQTYNRVIMWKGWGTLDCSRKCRVMTMWLSMKNQSSKDTMSWHCKIEILDQHFTVAAGIQKCSSVTPWLRKWKINWIFSELKSERKNIKSQ